LAGTKTIVKLYIYEIHVYRFPYKTNQHKILQVLHRRKSMCSWETSTTECFKE